MKSCQYCGNNPVPHSVFYINESLNILFTPLRQKILYNPLTKFLLKKGVGRKCVAAFLFLGESLKIISRRDDITKCKVRRAQVLWEEAEKRGMKMQELLLFGKPFDCYVVSRSASQLVSKSANQLDSQTADQLISGLADRLVFSGLPRPKNYYNNRLDIMDDKAWFKKEMAKNGLPVPIGGAVTSFSEAKKILKAISDQRTVDSGQSGPSTHYPLPTAHFEIAKPRSGSRGRHSTTFISSEEELKKAYKIAKQLCHWVVVEQQLFGPVYRATVINFKLEGVLRGDSPQVVGDGQQTISQLVFAKNQVEHKGVKDIILDDRAEMFVGRQLSRIGVLSSFTPKKNDSDALAFVFGGPPKDATPRTTIFDFIPELGQVIFLSEKIGVNYGGSSSEDFEICHPDNIALFEKTARVLGDPIVGFDFIIPDITKSWKNQLSGFIEVNTLPFINLHHDPLLGKPRNVAEKVWDMALY